MKPTAGWDSKVTGKLDVISEILGKIQAQLADLKERRAEDHDMRVREHAENQMAIRNLTAILDKKELDFLEYQRTTEAEHVAYRTATDSRLDKLELLQPIVAGLQLTKTKLTTMASIGFVVIVIMGWFVESGIKWLVDWVLSHFRV